MHSSHPVKCIHTLVHCEQCDVIYCSLCKEEWKKLYYSFNTTYPSTETGTAMGSGTTLFNHNCL